MKDFQSRFLHFVIDHEILQFGKFELKSGRKSPYFFNAGLFNTGGKMAFLARCYADAILDSKARLRRAVWPGLQGHSPGRYHNRGVVIGPRHRQALLL
jgi:orotate phosphoribosyltransferase